MSILKKFYNYVGVDYTTINGEQLYSLICLLGKERKTIKLQQNPLDMCREVLLMYIDYMETGKFKYITEQDIITALNCMN